MTRREGGSPCQLANARLDSSYTEEVVTDLSGFDSSFVLKTLATAAARHVDGVSSNQDCLRSFACGSIGACPPEWF